ncbi:hypothetical protein [Hymenobacter glacieicola]|uniref:DUF5723 domain-containing protein n=1 Tax=Hymenobacter glacieicola TaxID=1562124 RepID=A0ABQ1WLS9_9BACT|nr:hypothetical protein [Hymenobacter glacieicola]GGG35638.1 hypothetical protein GCM10011378_09860 [Hymenobacter glacieicola]
MKRALLSLVLAGTLFTYTACKGQDIGSDSKGGSVFTVYALKSVRAELNTKEPLALSRVAIVDSVQKVNTSTGIRTVRKVHGITTRLALSNSGKNVVLSNLLSTKLGVEARLGYQIVVDSVTNLDAFPGTFSIGGGLISGFDNFLLYDKASNTVSHERPFNIGAEVNYNFYFAAPSGVKKPTRWVIALNTSIVRTWNSDDLISYQNLDKATIAQNAVAFEKFEGRYGTLDKSVWKGRASIAVPVFFWHINLIPFYAVSTNFNNKTKSTPGVNLNYVTQPIQWYKYKFPSSVGLGLDWFDKKASKPNLFIRGAFSI